MLASSVGGQKSRPKASGIVMCDPREVTIALIGHSQARAANSQTTGAKIKPAVLTFYALQTPQTGETILLEPATVGRPRSDHHVIIRAGELPSLELLNLD